MLSEFALDDAIQSVDVTEGGSVWVSYFDEGIFGNGIFAPFGFIKTDLKGNVLWTAEKFAICDCYAVNIDRETSSWFYYYSDFKLVHIHGEKTVTYSPKIEGACCFAVLDNYILMQGGSDNRQKFILLEIKGRRLHKLGEITFGDRHGKALIQASYAIRGSHVLVSTKNDIFYGQIGYSDLF